MYVSFNCGYTTLQISIYLFFLAKVAILLYFFLYKQKCGVCCLIREERRMWCSTFQRRHIKEKSPVLYFSCLATPLLTIHLYTTMWPCVFSIVHLGMLFLMVQISFRPFGFYFYFWKERWESSPQIPWSGTPEVSFLQKFEKKIQEVKNRKKWRKKEQRLQQKAF